jgi:hypothetical protein
MSDLNAKVYAIISKLEAHYQTIVQKLHDSQQEAYQARLDIEKTLLRAEHAEKELLEFQEKHKQQEKQSDTDAFLDSLDMPIILDATDSVPEVPIDNSDNNNHADITILTQNITNLDIKNQCLEEKYQTTYALLQKEMVKVDTMQMELELLQRERDIALRKQSMTPEQKQLFVKLEYENYKIYETIERIDYISDELKKILGGIAQDTRVES